MVGNPTVLKLVRKTLLLVMKADRPYNSGAEAVRERNTPNRRLARYISRPMSLSGSSRTRGE